MSDRRLYVDIEKKIGSFQLKVCFEAGDESLSLLGASGCGKTMTLKCIAGIEKPDRGRILLGERVLFDSEKRIDLPPGKRHVGFLFQDYALFPNMSVAQNIACGAGSKERTEEVIERFYLRGKEKLYPHQLSGGQKQRVALARMLSASPEVVLLDEPFSALDNYLKMQLERRLMEMMETYEGPVVFVSHDRNEVYRLTRQVAVMEDGRIVERGPTAALFEKPKTLAAVKLTGCKNISHLVKEKDRFMAADWGIQVPPPPAGEDAAYVGFRAHFFERVWQEGPEVIDGEVLRSFEDAFSTIVLLRNRKGPGPEDGGSILTWELPKEEWKKIQGQPLKLRCPAEKLIYMKE